MSRKGLYSVMGCGRIKGPDSIEARMEFIQRHSFYGMVIEKNDISDNSFEKELKSEMEKLNNGKEQ